MKPFLTFLTVVVLCLGSTSIAQDSACSELRSYTIAALDPEVSTLMVEDSLSYVEAHFNAADGFLYQLSDQADTGQRPHLVCTLITAPEA